MSNNIEFGIRLTADGQSLVNEVKASREELDRLGKSAKDTGSEAARLNRESTSLSNSLSGLKSVAATIGLGLIASEAVALADSYTKLTAGLSNATNSAAQFSTAMADVKRISSAAQSDINATAQLYAKLNMALAENGTSQAAIARITETVSLGLKVNGASAGEAASTMLQLSQAFGSGVLRGEEFNAMAEASPNLLRALAASMGVSYGELRNLSTQGALTSEVLSKAFSDPTLLASYQQQAKSMQTISGAAVELKNQLELSVGAFMKQSGATAAFSSAIGGIASGVAVMGNHIGAVTAASTGLAVSLGAFVSLKAGVAAYESAAGFMAMRAATLAAAEANYAKVASDMMAGTSAKASAAASLAQAEANMTLTGSLVTAKNAMLGFIASNPILAISAALFAGVLAWKAWGNAAEDSANQAVDAIKKAHDERQRIWGMDNASRNAEISNLKSLNLEYNNAAEKLRAETLDQKASVYQRAEAGKQLDVYKKKIEENTVSITKLAEANKSTIAPKLTGDAAYIVKGYDELVKKLNEGSISAAKFKEEHQKLVDSLNSKPVKVEKAITASENFIKSLQKENEEVGISAEQKRAYEMIVIASNITKEKERVAFLATAGAIIESTAAKVAEKKATDEAKKAGEEAIKLLQSHTMEIYKEIEATNKQIEAAKWEGLIIGKTKEQIDLLKAAKEDAYIKQLEQSMTVQGLSQSEIILIQEQINKTKELSGQLSSNADKQARQVAIEAEKKAQVEMWKTIESTAHDTWNKVWEGGSNAFQNIGKTLKSAVLDLLYQMTLKKWIISISATAMGTTASAAGATDMFGGSASGGGMMGLVSAGQTLWSGFAGGMASGLGTIASTAGTAFGSTALAEFGAGASFAGTAATAGATGMAAAGSMVATAIPYVAAAYAIYSLISSFSSSSTAITGSGLNIGGKVGAPQTSGYTAGTTTDSSWWGLSSSSSNWRSGSAADQATSAAISNMFAGIGAAISMAGTSIGRDAATLNAQIKNYAITIGDLNMAGMNATQQQAAITAAVSGVADAMVAQLLPGMERFKTAAETLLQTLVRVATEVVTLNTFYAALGTTTKATTDSADRMSVALGGIAQASQHMTSFVQAFAPEAQKTALTLGTLKSAGLGMAEFLTTTQAWWDFARTASADQLTAILANQTAIAAYVAAMDKAAQATQAAIKTLQDKSVADFNAAVSATNALRAFADSVRALQQSLWAGANSPLASQTQADQLRARFVSTNTAAAAGDVTAQGNLAGSATAFLDAAKKQASSAESYARDFSYVQNALSDTATKTDVAVTVADKQLAELKQMNLWLAAISTTTTAQNLTQSVATAATSAGTAGAAVTAQQTSTAATATAATNATAQAAVDATAQAKAQAAADAQATAAAATAAAASAARVKAKADALAAMNAAATAITNFNAHYNATSLKTSPSLNADLMALNSNVTATRTAYNALPAFASGGDHFGGLRLVGEHGPEIEVTGPSRIFNADQTKAMLNGGNNAELLARVDALIAEVALLRAENQAGQVALVIPAQKTAKILDRFNGEGMPPVRLAA